MSTERRSATTGVVLVTVGVLLVLAAIYEQPDLVQFSPNRFYTVADLRELEAAHQEFNDLQTGRDLLTANVPSDDEQQASQSEQIDSSQSPERAARLAAAEARHQELQQKQDRAFRNQGVVSQTLKWTGIALLVGAALFLRRTSKTQPGTHASPEVGNLPS